MPYVDVNAMGRSWRAGNRCQGWCNQNRRCRARASRGGTFCRYHQYQADCKKEERPIKAQEIADKRHEKKMQELQELKKKKRLEREELRKRKCHRCNVYRKTTWDEENKLFYCHRHQGSRPDVVSCNVNGVSVTSTITY